MALDQPILEVFEPAKKLDPVERQKQIDEKTAQMKAIIKARKEKEADQKLRDEQEQRRRSLAPNLYDDDDSSSCVSMDLDSSPKRSDTPPQDIAQAISPYAAALIATYASSESQKPVSLVQAPQINGNSRASSPPPKRVVNLSIDTQKKRPYDAISNSGFSSRKGSNASSPMFASPAISISPITGMSTLGAMPRIPKKPKASVSEIPSPASANNSLGQELGLAPLPEWYINARAPVNTRDHALSYQRRIWGMFDHLKKSVKICEAALNPEERTAAVNEVGKLLHDLEFVKVTPFALFKYKMLHDGQGLKKIADGINFPWYLRADAQELYNKWLHKIWDPDMFRGIKNMIKGKEIKGGPAIDEEYKLEWRFHGEGNFVVGQWWANQICAVRDGAHGSAQAGIAGLKGVGATSIVLSEGHKEDVDQGEEIWYCGTEAKPGEKEPTASTKLMLENIKSKKPVRVLRSSSLPTGNVYKPEKGFRYDGLYKVLDMKPIDRNKYHYLFHLKRLPNQIGMRYEGEAARPTKRELEEHEVEMKKYGRRKNLG